MDATSPRRSAKRGDARRRVLRFVVGETQYALYVESVREVVHKGNVTLIPNLPSAVEGVTDHRGVVVPIVDLRILFGQHAVPSHKERRPEKWIMADSPHGIVGFVVDRVIDVLGLTDEPRRPMSLGRAGDARPISGVVSVEGELVFLLDVEKLSGVVSHLSEVERDPTLLLGKESV